MWKRYIDDIFFFICSGTDSQLAEFHELVNASSDALTFTMDAQLDQIHFSDVNVILTETGLVTSLYHKPTNHNMFLHGSSYHLVPLNGSLPIRDARS